MIDTTISTDQLLLLLIQAKNEYYNSGSSLLPDADFDEYEQLLRLRAADHPYFTSVGSKSTANGKIIHSVAMLSSDKAKSMDDITRWLKKINLPESTQFIIEPKIDGLSATIKYEDGCLRYVATRGDGHLGQDITHVASFMASIPQHLPSNMSCEVRGELYLPKNSAYNTAGKPRRNNCVGLINRKESRSNLHFVHFIAYQLIGPAYNSEEEALKQLKELGFDVVPHLLANSSNDISSSYQHYLNTLRTEWLYETDGLIIIANEQKWHTILDAQWIVDHHHHYAIALKPPAEVKTTTLKMVEWQISRSGNAIPVAVFEPLEIGGATIERASLHNAQVAKDFLLQANDQLLIERANDVIPYVRDNLARHNRLVENFSQPLIIKECPSCQQFLNSVGVHLKCLNNACPEQHLQQIIYWVKCCAMENIAEATLRSLYSQSIITKIADLYSLTKESFIGLHGFGDKKIKNFLSEVRKSHIMPARTLISRLGINLVADKALKKLGINSMTDFFDFTDITYVIGQNLIEWRDDPANKLLVAELLEALTIIDEEVSVSPLGEVCMTGKGPLSRGELEDLLHQKGYSSSSTVTSKTVLLLCDDITTTSSKLQKAKKNNIQIMHYNDFFTENL